MLEKFHGLFVVNVRCENCASDLREVGVQLCYTNKDEGKWCLAHVEGIDVCLSDAKTLQAEMKAAEIPISLVEAAAAQQFENFSELHCGKCEGFIASHFCDEGGAFGGGHYAVVETIGEDVVNVHLRGTKEEASIAQYIGLPITLCCAAAAN